MKRSNTNRGQSSSKSKYGRGNFDEDDGNTRKFVPADGSVKMEQSNSLSLDERNKLAAKILKAEMKGDMALIEKLKKKLAGEKKEVGNVILMKVDERTGLVTPACKSLPHSSKSKETIAGIFGKEQDFSDMLAEEKMTSASDQITMFERSTKVMGSVKTDDDHTIDDNLLIHPTKKYHAEKDARKLKQQNVKEANFFIMLLVRGCASLPLNWSKMFELNRLLFGCAERFSGKLNEFS
uniref:DUF5681 domain-containing protein n=1 Tax=Rhabditophanes sp. KR3021 TaxID=114890 RepID=A0AC35TM69_9BILA